MPVAFDVSPVELAQGPLPRQPFRLGFERLVGAKVESCGGRVTELVDGVADHPFLATLRLAFDRHYPIVLRPDDVWLLLAQGLAHHLKTHSEELRSRFVPHEGRSAIVIQRNDFVLGRSENPWPETFAAFSDAIARVIGRKRDLIVANFSTTGPAERAAYEVVLLDAMQHYFRYALLTLCGIPRITLLGTPEDWRSIQERARNFGEFGLESWVRALEPVLDQFASASGGKVDALFWQSFYKYISYSGGPYVSGWVNVFFPYVRSGTGGELGANPHALAWKTEEGPRTDQFPAGMSRAPFEWRYFEQTIPMEFLGGFAGVSQDAETLALRPEIGWAVRPAASGTTAPTTDPNTGREVHHVLIVGARGSVLDDVLEQARSSLQGWWRPGDESFDAQADDVTLRVHKGTPSGVVPSAVVLVISGVDSDWTSSVAGVAQLEQTLLATGRLRETPILGLWGGGGLADSDPDTFYESIPIAVRALFRHVDFFRAVHPDSIREQMDEVRERVTRR